MNRTLLLTGILAVMGACASGCLILIPVPVPGQEVVSPGVKGRVLDAGTMAPIPGARVSVVGRPEEWVETAEDGTFFFPVDKDTFLLRVHTPCPIYKFPKPREYTDKVTVAHTGYRAVEIPVKLFPVEDEEQHRSKRVYLVGDILLTPLE